MPDNLSNEAFFRLVQNPATRLTDVSDLIRLSLARLEDKSADLFSRCAAFCVISYRYLEHLNNEEFQYLAEILKSNFDIISVELSHINRSGLWMRWFTSFTMAYAYINLAHGRYSNSLTMFQSVVNNSPNLHLWVQMTSSHVAACLFAGSLTAATLDNESALILFNEAGEIFKSGVKLLDLNSYWMTFELRGALAYLCEVGNERDLILIGERKHQIGKYLWHPFNDLLTIATNARFTK